MLISIADGQKCIIHILATPGASADRVGEIIVDANKQSYLKIYVTTIPEKGQANKAIIKLLSKILNLAKSKFIVEHGETNRRKRIRIDAPHDNVLLVLQKYLS